MPPKKNKRQKKSHSSTSRCSNSMMSEVSSTTSTMDESALNSTMRSTISSLSIYTKEALIEKRDEMLRRLEERGQKRIEEIANIYSALCMSLTPEHMRIPISLDKLSDVAAIMSDAVLEISATQTKKLMTPGSAAKLPRRSRSAHFSDRRLAAIEESPRPLRSSSVGTPAPSTFKTPLNRIAMTASKYTVRRPFGQPQNPAVRMKRIMRAGEEAISTSGSPLFVQARVPSQPELNIPLNNGVILNIDPENSSQSLAVPQIDMDTRRKLQIICQKIQKCIYDGE